LSAHLGARFHRFKQAGDLLEKARSRGHPRDQVDSEEAALLQATGHYEAALVLRRRLAQERPSIQTIGALASLLAEMDDWRLAERNYAAALEADDGVSPLPAAQLLFEWGVGAMRQGELDRADSVLAALQLIMPAHVPGRGHRAEVAIARGRLDLAMALIAPLAESSDDPEYRAVYAELLLKMGDPRAATELAGAYEAYESLLARRPEAYADHAAAFLISVGMHPRRALELATLNWTLRDTPRSRRLLERARHAAAFDQMERRAC
jgi:tetratricopeptide (TPR) repeat protein